MDNLFDALLNAVQTSNATNYPDILPIENKAVYTLKQELKFREEIIRESWPLSERERYPDLYNSRLRDIKEIKAAIEILTKI